MTLKSSKSTDVITRKASGLYCNMKHSLNHISVAVARYRYNLLEKGWGYLVLEPATLTSVPAVRRLFYRLGHVIVKV